MERGGITQFRLKQSWSQKNESRMLSCRHFGHWRELAGLPQPAHLREDVSSVVLGCDSPTEGIVLSVAGMKCPCPFASNFSDLSRNFGAQKVGNSE